MPNERDPSLQDMMVERYGRHATSPPPAPYLENRPAFTPALMAEAGIPPLFHRTLLSLRQCPTGPPTCWPTPASCSQRQPPTTTGTKAAAAQHTDRRARRRQTAIAKARIGAEGAPPLSPETIVEYVCIFAVINDRRHTRLWSSWQLEAHDLCQQVLDQLYPTRRQHLERYATMRALVRKKRRTWKLAEHITDLDPLLDQFS